MNLQSPPPASRSSRHPARFATRWLGFGLALLIVGCSATPIELESKPRAQLLIDLEAGTVEAQRGGIRATGHFDPVVVRAGLRSLVATLAAGGDDPGLRRALGDSLLTPARGTLQSAKGWTVQSAGAVPTPGDLAPLASLILPWATGDVTVAEHHCIRFAWARDFVAAQNGVERGPNPESGQRLLLIAPFREGHTPISDDSDTLRAALRSAVAHVDLIPRNDTNAASVRRALEPEAYAVVWLRATPSILAEIRPAMGAFPSTVIWTLPGDAAGVSPAPTPRSFSSGGIRPGALIAPAWAIAESELSALAADLADALVQGLTVDRALTYAQRRAIERGEGPNQWASLAAITTFDVGAALAPAPWLRRQSAQR